MRFPCSYPGEYNNHNVNNPNDTFCYCTFAGLYDQVNLKRAFGWSLTQTQAFMVGVVDNPSTYGVDSQVVPELKRLHTDIVALSENGAKYQTGDPYPQPFSRIVNPAAASKNES
ncbi:hypothetical protein E8E15_000058, partial [Penicillium rubens]